MQMLHPALPRRRLLAGSLAATLLVAVVAEYAHGSPGWWQLAVFGLGPDVAGLLSIEPGLARGRMSPRAVPLYNLLHRAMPPVLLGMLALAGLVPAVLFVGALVWGLHISFDRAVGYGLRRADGRQR
jgi:hypothetical protein